MHGAGVLHGQNMEEVGTGLGFETVRQVENVIWDGPITSGKMVGRGAGLEYPLGSGVD